MFTPQETWSAFGVRVGPTSVDVSRRAAQQYAHEQALSGDRATPSVRRPVWLRLRSRRPVVRTA